MLQRLRREGTFKINAMLGQLEFKWNYILSAIYEVTFGNGDSLLGSYIAKIDLFRCFTLVAFNSTELIVLCSLLT